MMTDGGWENSADKYEEPFFWHVSLANKGKILGFWWISSEKLVTAMLI